MTPRGPNRCAVLTPPGAGAIGVIRVQGPDVKSVISSMLRRPVEPPCDAAPRSGAEADRRWRNLFPRSDRLVYGLLVVNDETLDDVVISLAPGGATPAIDICVHGGVRVMERIIEALESHAVFLTDDPGLIDAIWRTDNVIEREVDEALRAAQTARAARFLTLQRSQLPDVLCNIAAQCTTAPADAEAALRGLVAGFDAAHLLLTGATVTLIGPPNSGKSTLFNKLVGRSAAIVSEQAGTTRDWVSARVEFDGMPSTLVDTAGGRNATASLEKLAIEMGRSIGEQANLHVLVLDGSSPLPGDVRRFQSSRGRVIPMLVVSNKDDAGRTWIASDLSSAMKHPGLDAIHLSALSGAGVPDLVRQILRELGCGDGQPSGPSLFTERQVELAREILSDLPRHGGRANVAILERLLCTDPAPRRMPSL